MSALADKLFERALVALKVKDFVSADGLCVEAVKFKPNFYEAWVMRGNIAHAQERPMDAVLNYEKALDIKPDLRDAWNNIGLAFGSLGMWKAAEDAFHRSIAVTPSFEPYVGLANMYCTLMQLDDACKHYRKALEFGDDPKVRFNLGVTMLGLGQWEEGFKQYECRWRDTPFPARAHVLYPKWQGEPLAGKTIILHSEQGYGDEIMSLRFADKQLLGAARVILQVREPILRLAETLPFDIDEIIPIHGELPNGIDIASPLLDVPMCLKMQPLELPLYGRYLRAPDQYRVQEWKKRLPKEDRNVGVCWQSGGHLETAKAAQMQKSIPMHMLRSFMVSGVNLISLQKPAVPNVPDEITDWMDECDTFSDTAALIEALDLVITVDTAVAHLAGALGKPVWNFVRFSGYWPWLVPGNGLDPHYSIWYPAMTLFRQPQLNDWAAPIQKARNKLMLGQ